MAVYEVLFNLGWDFSLFKICTETNMNMPDRLLRKNIKFEVTENHVDFWQNYLSCHARFQCGLS